MKRMILFSCLFFLVFSQVLLGQIPQTISYQGILTDANGTAVPDGNYSVTFKLYEAATGGTPLWSEEHSVAVSNGLIYVTLGSLNPLNIAFDKRYWLGITLGEGSELTSRIELTSSAYSLNARSIADSIVTSSKIASSQVVRSINLLKDDVTLAAGNNVTITQNDNTLTIAAAAGSGGNTLDQAYDQGGPAAGRKITADAGPVLIKGDFGLDVISSLVIGRGTHSVPPEARLESFGEGLGLYLNQSDAKDIYIRYVVPFASWWTVGPKANGDFWFSTSKNLSQDALLTIQRSTGNVGISTTRPLKKLHVQEDDLGLTLDMVPTRGMLIEGVNSALYIYSQNETRGASALNLGEINADGTFGNLWTMDREANDTGDGNLHFRYGNNPMYLANPTHLIITKEGNIGIGTTNPDNILTVQRNSATDPIADAWMIYSSKRWKTNIKPIEGALEKVQRLRGVHYDWKATGKHDIGLIAEEVGEVIPEVVEYEVNGKDAKSVDYARLVAVLIEAIKEQQREINELKVLVKSLTSERYEPAGRSIGELR